jgi:hypothetical protein
VTTGETSTNQTPEAAFADRVLGLLRDNYISQGYVYSGSMSPGLVARRLGVEAGKALEALVSLVERGIVKRRGCEALSFELPAVERLRLIIDHGLARRWEETAACFHPNEPTGEVGRTRREAQAEESRMAA